MASVYWRKDEPDDFQVRDVNVPGVFPRQSLKINSSTVTTSVKPWLRPRNTRTSRSKQGHFTSSEGIAHSPHKKMPPLPSESTQAVGDKSRVAPKSKASASLKDLSFEDKKRVANLIKELAKAGEERKLAVNALHQERTVFHGKEESLKRQQEKLISERDELREKILEYQFLINQYSKQIQHEKESFDAEEAESIAQEKQGLPGNKRGTNESITAEGNLKPPLPMRDLDEKIQTYYSVPASKDSRYCGEIPVICDKKSEYLDERPNTREDGKVINSDIGHEPNHANTSAHKTYYKSSNNTPTRDSVKPDINDVSMGKCDEKGDVEVERRLLEQQNKLLEQQNMIQQQLENLQILQQKYAEEFSQIITHSEDLKQAISAEKRTIEISKQQDERHSNMTNDRVSTETINKEGSDNEKHSTKANSDIVDGSRLEGIQFDESPYHKRTTSHYSHEQGTSVIDSKQFTQQQIPNLHSYVNKSIEQIPGYLLHTSDVPLLEKSMSMTKSMSQTTPNRSLLVHSNGVNIHKKVTHESKALQTGSIETHQLQPAMKHDSFTQIQYHSPSRKRPSLSLQSSILSQKNNNHMSNTNVEDNLSHYKSSHPNGKGTTYKNKKQYSLLQSFDEFENEHSIDEDDNFFNPGSYHGFAKSILEGKYKNEQIFASTDYSDDGSEPEDSELIADMFFLKRS